MAERSKLLTDQAGRVRLELADYPQLKRKGGVLHLPEHGVLIVRSKRKLRAFSDRCPHKPRSKNRVTACSRKASTCLRCDAHGWTWNRKGRPTGKAEKRLERVPARFVGNQLVLELGR